MKKLILLALCICGWQSAMAQDVLVKKSGDVEKVKVIEISDTEIKYKQFDNQDGPLYVAKKSDYLSVTYENGKTEKFAQAETTATAAPATTTTTAVAVRRGPGVRRRGVVVAQTTQTQPQTQTQTQAKTQTQTQAPKKQEETKQASSNGGKVDFYAPISKRIRSSFDIYIADQWGVGYHLQKNFNKYFAWDIFSLSYMSDFTKGPDEFGLVNVRLLGVRGYTPAIKVVRGYMNIDIGYTWSYQAYYRHDGGRSVSHYHGFGLDFGAGIQIFRFLNIGYNLNYGTQFSDCTHWCKIGFEF